MLKGEVQDWPTVPVVCNDLGYRLNVPQEWTIKPEIYEDGLQTTHTYWGNVSSDWLVISKLRGTGSSSDLETWLDTSMALVNFPVEVIASKTAAYNLVQWLNVPIDEVLVTRLEVNRLILYEGLAEMSGMYEEFTRLYVLLALRKDVAWRIALSFTSRCLPATPQSVVVENDHIRAGATFGSLHFQ